MSEKNFGLKSKKSVCPNTVSLPLTIVRKQHLKPSVGIQGVRLSLTLLRTDWPPDPGRSTMLIRNRTYFFWRKKNLLPLLESSLYLSWSKPRSNFKKSMTLWFYYLNPNYKSRIDEVEKCHFLLKATFKISVTGRTGTQASLRVLTVTFPICHNLLPKMVFFHI